MSSTPKVGDSVSVNLMIEGHLLFSDLRGSIKGIDHTVAEIAATLPVGDVPLIVPTQTLKAAGSDAWQVTARAYVSRT